tara:strand:- start:629 stop:1027 length:399 start_codon:yes stop_codon:yes gene_type:complete
MKKLAYVTKKQVSAFIEHNLEYNFNGSVQAFINEVNVVLSDLSDFPEDNANQLKFYRRVRLRLSKPIYWVLTIYNGDDDIISQEVIENKDEGIATNMAYVITEGSVEHWDWTLKRETFWEKFGKVQRLKEVA